MHQVIESKESHLPTVSTHLVLLGIQTHMFLSQSEQGISSTFFTTSLFLQGRRSWDTPRYTASIAMMKGRYVFSFRLELFYPCNLCNLCNFLSSLKHQNVVLNNSFLKKIGKICKWWGFPCSYVKLPKDLLTATHRQWFAKLEKKTVPCQLLYILVYSHLQKKNHLERCRMGGRIC